MIDLVIILFFLIKIKFNLNSKYFEFIILIYFIIKFYLIKAIIIIFLNVNFRK